MTIFDPARGRVIDGGGHGGGALLRLIGLGIAAFLLVILLFSSVTRVGTGHVGRAHAFRQGATGETLGEGIHLINPLKTNNELSIQTQTLKESASVPSSEGLMMSSRHLADLSPQSGSRRRGLPEDRRRLRERGGRADAALRHPRSDGVAHRERSLHRRARNGGQADLRSGHAANSKSAA